MKLEDAIKGFMISCAADGYSKSTTDLYGWALRLMCSQIDKDAENINYTDLQKFFGWLKTEYTPKRTNGDKSPLTPRSIENAWTAVRSFYNWASVELAIKERPDTKLKRPEYTPTEIDPLDEDELRKLITACERTTAASTTKRKAFTMRRPTGKRDLAIVLTLLDTGLRVSELARLRVSDVDMDKGEVFVEPFGSGRKTKSRLVYIGKITKKALWRYLADRDYVPGDRLFVTEHDRPMDRTSIRVMLNALGKRASVPNVHPHRFRHTFAIQYLRNGGDVFTLQRLLGHSSLDMVLHYLKLADADSAAAHKRASPADRWKL